MTKEEFLVILKYVVWGSAFLILFIPLLVANGNFFPNMFFPYITGKNIVFRLLVELMTLSWIFLALFDTEYRSKKSSIFWVVGVFVFVIGLADLLGENPFKSFFSNYERMEGWVTVVHLGLYTIVMGTMFSAQKLWHGFFHTSVAISGWLGLVSLIQYTNSTEVGTRVDATLGNPAYLAIYMMVHIFLTIWLLVRSWSTAKESPWMATLLWYMPILLLQLSSLFTTATRGPALGLVGGLGLIALLIALTEKQNKMLKQSMAALVVAGVLLIGLFIGMRDSQFVQSNLLLKRLASISISDTTTLSRFTIWNMAYQGFMERPILGWGQENFNYIFNKYYDPKMYDQEQWFDRTHNVVLDWLVAGGSLGLISYMALWGVAVYLLWRKTTLSAREKSIFTGLFAGYFFQNLFVFDNITSYVLFFSLLAYIHTLVTEKEKVISTQELSPQVSSAVTIISILGIGAVCYVSALVPFAGAVELIVALQTPPQQVEQKLEAFKSVIEDRSVGLYEAREQLYTSVPSVVRSGAESAVIETYVAYAQAQAQHHVMETPHDARPWLLAGSFFQQVGVVDIAAQYYEKAHELSPRKQPIMLALGSLYFSAQKQTEGLEWLKKAYEVYPANTEARNTYALGLLMTGDRRGYDELVPEGVIMEQRFLATYQQTKNYDLMITYLERDAEAQGHTLQAEGSLAVGYWFAGKRTEAIAAFTRALKLTDKPEEQQQIQSFIAEVRAGKMPPTQ